MSRPEITEQINGYKFRWAEEKLDISVSRVQVHSSDGRVTGELLISSALVNNKAIYPPSSFNFTAERSRSSLAKSLNENFPKWDWKDILNQVCIITVKRARAGEPIQELWTNEDILAPEYLLEPLLIKGLPTIIFGEKGVTKSTTAVLIYICLTLPWHDNPLGWKVPTRSVKTAIFDYELPGVIAQYNAQRIQKGMDLPPFALLHRRCRLPIVDDIEPILNWITNLEIEVLIIDSLARGCGGDLIKTEPANAFFEALDKLNVTSLILAQTSKDIENKRKTIYGNALFTYYARNIFELCRSDFSQEDELDVGLFHRFSNLSKLYPDTGFKISFNSQGTHIESQPISVGEFKAKVNSQKAILEELKSGALSVKDIMERTGASDNTIRVILSKLKKRGIVTNPQKGQWGLRITEY